MKPNWIGIAAGALLAGLAAGFGTATLAARSGAPASSALLREFSFAAFARQAAYTNWSVLEDRLYEPFPSLGRSQRVARRIVAQAEMSENELGRFSVQLQQALRSTFSAHHAINKGQYNLGRDSWRNADGASAHHRLDLPRHYYAIGDIHGVLDCWQVANAGQVTLILSFIEGR